MEPYLGVFERLWIAYSISQIDIATIEHRYGYRIRNIWANHCLVETKLENKDRRGGWSMFIALTYTLEDGKPVEERIKEHTDNWQPREWLTWRKQKDKSLPAQLS